MFTALGTLLARSVAPAVAEHLARSGVQALQARLGRDPSLAPATSAEIVAAVDGYNADPARAWTRARLFAFIGFFVSADANGTVRWIESPARIVDYVLRGVRPGEEAERRAAVARALEAEMESVRELIARYLNLAVAETGASPDASAQAPAPVDQPAIEPLAGDAETPAASPPRTRLTELLEKATTSTGAAFSAAAGSTRDQVARVQQNARAASSARRARAAVVQSLELLHAGGVGLAQAEVYLLCKDYPADVVGAVVAERIRGG